MEDHETPIVVDLDRWEAVNFGEPNNVITAIVIHLNENKIWKFLDTLLDDCFCFFARSAPGRRKVNQYIFTIGDDLFKPKINVPIVIRMREILNGHETAVRCSQNRREQRTRKRALMISISKVIFANKVRNTEEQAETIPQPSNGGSRPARLQLSSSGVNPRRRMFSAQLRGQTKCSR